MIATVNNRQLPVDEIGRQIEAGMALGECRRIQHILVDAKQLDGALCHHIL